MAPDRTQTDWLDPICLLSSENARAQFQKQPLSNSVRTGSSDHDRSRWLLDWTRHFTCPDDTKSSTGAFGRFRRTTFTIARSAARRSDRCCRPCGGCICGGFAAAPRDGRIGRAALRTGHAFRMRRAGGGWQRFAFSVAIRRGATDATYPDSANPVEPCGLAGQFDRRYAYAGARVLDRSAVDVVGNLSDIASSLRCR